MTKKPNTTYLDSLTDLIRSDHQKDNPIVVLRRISKLITDEFKSRRKWEWTAVAELSPYLTFHALGQIDLWSGARQYLRIILHKGDLPTNPDDRITITRIRCTYSSSDILFGMESMIRDIQGCMPLPED